MLDLTTTFNDTNKYGAIYEKTNAILDECRDYCSKQFKSNMEAAKQALESGGKIDLDQFG